MAKSKNTKGEKARVLKRELELRSLEDSLLSQVKMEDLLDDEVYQKLAYEGWTPPEIMKIMQSALTDKQAARMKDSYGIYKRWLPDYAVLPAGDSLYMTMDTVVTEAMRRSVESKAADDFNAYWEPLPYVPPKNRPKGEARKPGYFRQPKLKPSVGRMICASPHPDNPDYLYATSDGGGLFRTYDNGKHWDCISERVPNRYDRVYGGHGIPVDPDDWNHMFHFSNRGPIYETFDAGESWTKVEGAAIKNFKRVFCFRDKQDNLKFVGCTRSGNVWLGCTVWISEDKGVTWIPAEYPDEIKDIHPNTGELGEWFQEVIQDPSDRDMIYFPTSRSIYYLDNGARGEMIDGRRVFRLKKLHIEVYDREGVERRYADHPIDMGKDPEHQNETIFPCPSNIPGNLFISPFEPDKWWFVTGCYNCGQVNASALFSSEDHGRTWKTVHDKSKYGSINASNHKISAYGYGMADGWLGAFGVNYSDPNYMAGAQVYTGMTSDGGKTFRLYDYMVQSYSQQPELGDGFYAVSGTYHNSDNHYIATHKSGRFYRCSDTGILCWDRNIRGDSWFNISGDMGQMLFYWVATNEFGDQIIFGTNQDVHAQTYRNGRWGLWLGYEGSEGWLNPYTQTPYTSGLQSNQGFDESDVSFDSWRLAETRADVVTGSWFFTRSGSASAGRTFNRTDDLGRSTVNLETILGEPISGVQGKFGLCRDKGRSTVYVFTRSNILKRSIDGGNTFETVLFNGKPAKFSGAALATDPNNSDVVYLGQRGKVYRYFVNESRFEELGEGTLPDINCYELFFHEGSGDLYFHDTDSGLFILEYDKEKQDYVSSWRYWTKGYNLPKCNKAEINYTTQEMVISVYGRGAWCADLEHPADRFFTDGFALRECSFKDGRHTIGIDTEWTIPLYYYFKWTVNGEEVTDNPYQYLRRRLNPGDRVQLELTLRESPDVHTTSAVFIVPRDGNAPGGDDEQLAEGSSSDDETIGVSYDNPVVKESGRAITSNGNGRIDLGYMDYFFNDFTIDFWLRPTGDGTVLSNTTVYSIAREMEIYPKGFEISVEKGNLKFLYYPLNYFLRPHYEQNTPQSAELKAPIEYSRWTHVAITHERYGQDGTGGEVAIYINGVKKASGKRIVTEGTLNNSVVLSLFGDGIERKTIAASMDELKIWTRSLSEPEVRREMYSTNPDRADGLAAYWSFNGGSLESDIEEFSRHGMKPRIRAQVRYPEMIVPTCANSAIYENIDNLQHLFKKGDMNVMGITPAGTPASAPAADPAAVPANAAGINCNVGVYTYNAKLWKNEEDNLDTSVYIFQPVGYLIRPFDKIDLSARVDVDFYPCGGGDFDPNENYRFYVADPNLDKQVWERIGTSQTVYYNSAKKAITVSGVTLADIVDKKLLLVTTLPGIEARVTGLGDDGILPIYSESQTNVPLSATVLGGLTPPEGVFTLNGNGIILPSGLQFINGDAAGVLNLDLSKLGAFNTNVRATLRSNDNPIVDSEGNSRPSFIPITIDVRNRISPTALGTGVMLDNATAEIGTAADYPTVLNTAEWSIMGWVRIDDPRVLKTGSYSLMTFRGEKGKVTGLALENGKLMAVVNNQKMTVSQLGFTEEDLGNWVHVAVIAMASRKKIFYYKNGILDNLPKALPAIEEVGPFCLGKNSPIGTTSNADNFSGAFDQISVWSRAIDQTEVYKYMYSAVPMNDPGLALFANMDYTDRMGIHRDCFSNAEIKLTPTPNLSGSAAFDETPYLPYESREQSQWNDKEAVVTLKFNNPTNQYRFAVISTFRGTPFNYENPNYAEYVPLSKEYYAVTFLQGANETLFGKTVTITYRNPIIMEGDNLAVGMRRIGTTENMTCFVHGVAPADGIVNYEVPASYLENSSELMFFMYPKDDDPTGGRLANLRLSFAQEIVSKFTYDEDGVPLLKLEEDMTSIPIVAGVIGQGRYHADIAMSLKSDKNDKENVSYASCNLEGIDFGQPTIPINIDIDRSKINRYGMNDLYIDIDGAYTKTEPMLHLKFYVRPYVELSLVNGEHGDILGPGVPGESTDPEDPDDFDPEDTSNDPKPGDPDYFTQNAPRRAEAASGDENNLYNSKTPIASLEISAKLVEGYLPEGTPVELEVIGDLPTALNIGNGSLLKGEDVTIPGLDYLQSGGGSFHEGWNLIGNPYLTNINLTKSQNVNFDESSMTKFIYHCNAETGNYEVHDMTSYNYEHTIAPFQAFFVQTMADNTSLTVTPVAKEQAPTKRTMAYNVSEKQEIVLALESGDKTYDHVTIVYDNDASNSFRPNEDAAKVWNIEGSSPELVAITGDGKPVTITTVDASDLSDGVTLGVKTNEAGRKMALRCLTLTGMGSRQVIIHDNVANHDWNAALDGKTYEFTADPLLDGSLYNDHRFTVNINDIPTGTESLIDHGYRVYADNCSCIVTGLHGDAVISIFTPNGMKVTQTHTTENSFRAELQTGVYIVTIHENGKDYTSKIMVQ